MRRDFFTFSELVWTFIPFSAGRTQEACKDSFAGVDRTHAANAYRPFVLLMAENRDRDADECAPRQRR